MSNLTDLIEQYLFGLLAQQRMIELQRRELAKMFRCAPSQINYVLETRFTLERGYLIESKRGGGGYIRISQVRWETLDNLANLVENLIPEQLEADQAKKLLDNLVFKGFFSLETAQNALIIMEKDFNRLPIEQAAFLRAKFLKALLLMNRIKTEE